MNLVIFWFKSSLMLTNFENKLCDCYLYWRSRLSLKTVFNSRIFLCLKNLNIKILYHSAGDGLVLPVINSISALLQNLQESSQWELALRFVVGSFGTCLQHSVSNFMNASLSEKVELQEQILWLGVNIDVKALTKEFGVHVFLLSL